MSEPSPKTRWLFFVPVLVAVLAYGNTLPGDFVFDDSVLIQPDRQLRALDFGRIFGQDYWGPARDSNNYRPLVLLTYGLNFAVSEGAWSFHLVNLLLNAFVALLVYFVLWRLIEDAPLAAGGACLYTLLPIHVEAVANIVGRAELLSGAAIFGSWLLTLRPARATPALRFVSVGGITFLGLLSKENAAVVPAVLLSAALVCRRRIPLPEIVASSAAVLVYLLLRRLVLTDAAGPPSLIDNPLAHESPVTRIVNAVSLLGFYVYKIVLPLSLSADYSYNQIPVRPLSDPTLWVTAVALAGLVLVPAGLCRRSAPLVTLGAAFFAITFSPTANVLLPIGTIFGERLAYTPSFAYPLIVCAVCRNRIQGAPALRKPLLGLLCVLCVVYGTRTIIRNADWQDADTMYARMAQDAPRSTRSHLKKAEAHLRRALEARYQKGRKELEQRFVAEAERSVERALEIHPRHGRAVVFLGEIYLKTKRYAEAVETLTRGLRVLRETKVPEPIVLRLRGEALLNLKRLDEALKDLKDYTELLQRRSMPPDARAHNLRGLAFAYRNQLGEALREFDTALALDESLPEIWNNRGYAHFLMGNPGKALSDYQRGMEICRTLGVLYSPGRDSVWQFLRRIAAAHRAAGNEEAAREAEREAERIRRDETRE